MTRSIETETEMREFFRQNNLLYLPRTVVKVSAVSQFDWTQSEYYQLNRAEFESLTQRYGDSIRSARKAPLTLSFVDDRIGWGIFAAADLDVGTFLGEYTGYVDQLTDSPPDQKLDGRYLSDFSWNYPDALPNGEEFEINAFHAGNELRYVNHSFDPNSVVDHTVVDGIFVTFFRTVKPIRSGDQIFVDYGEEYWSGGFRELVVL